MARKWGLVGLVLTALAIFFASSVTALISTWLIQRLGIDSSSRLGSAIAAGVTSLVGFVYRRAMIKALRKAGVKLLVG